MLINFIINFIIQLIMYTKCSSTINTANKCLQISSACECSKSGPDLGLVFCDSKLKLANLNTNFFYLSTKNTSMFQHQLSIYKLTFKQNGIRLLNNLTFQRTGIYHLEIIQQRLIFLPNKSLFGLERTLRILSLESNQLISVPTLALAGLRKLTYLNLNYNCIRKLISDQLFPPSVQSTLKVLLIAHNQISHIDAFTFQNLKSLQHLDVSFNHLIFINDCAFCSSSLNLISNSKLLYFNLKSNRLSTVPFMLLSSLSGLQAVDLSDNLIEDVNDYRTSYINDFNQQTTYGSEVLQKPICLEYLNLESNQLTNLNNQTFTNFNCLRTLILSNNQIKMIDDNTFKNVEINQLNLKNNKLSKLTSGIFNGKENELTHLDISENMLDNQQNETFLISLEKLSSFKFNDNMGEFRLIPLSLAQSQYSLIELEFTQSNHKRNDQFNPINYEIEFKNLRRLSLNFLNQASFKKQLLAYGDYNLHYLDLSRSAGLVDLSDRDLFDSTPWLIHLNLSSNHIRKVNSNVFKPLKTLMILDLNSAFHPHLTRNFDCDLFKHLSSLKSLSLIENNIYQFKNNCFDQLSELRLLQLDFNHLTKLKSNQFDQLKSLIHLQLSNNNLDQIASNTFNELPKLIYIDLSFNLIQTIKSSAFNDLISLRIIDLSNNQLQTIEPDAFINLPYLEFINFNKNQLKEFSFASFDQIGALSKTLRFNLNSNKLITLKEPANKENYQNNQNYQNSPSATSSKFYPSFTGHNQLTMNFIEIIDLRSNHLEQIDSNDFLSLQNSLMQIHLDRNRLRKLGRHAFANLPQLQLLSLSQNFLTSLSDDLLVDDYELQEINLSSNLLTNLPSRLFFQNFKLKSIDLSNNVIKKLPNNLFSNCSNLEHLYLDHNNLREFPSNAFANRNSIKILSLSFNFIEFINLNLLATDIYKNLIYFNLSHNLVKQFDSNLFVNLVELDISFNKFEFDEVENLFANFYSSRMCTVDLSNTGLRQIPILKLPNLISLNLADNFLVNIYSHSFLHIEHLNTLILRNNRLAYVPTKLFNNQKLGETLIELDLSFNPIYSLNNDSFVGLKNLQKLLIHGLHKLHHIQIGVFQFLQLKELSLSYYVHQINSLCSLFSISNLETLTIHFDLSTASTFNRRFLFDSSLCSASSIGRLERIEFVGPIKHLDKDVFGELINKKLELKFTNTSIIKHLSLDLSTNSIQTLDLHLGKSFQSNPELNTLNSKKKFQLKTITFEPDTLLNCDCRSNWLKDHWKKLKLDTSKEIARWFLIDSQNDNHLHHHHLPDKDSSPRLFNNNQLDDLNKQNAGNLTYEQLIELNTQRLKKLETNLDEIKCRDEQRVDDEPVFIKRSDEKVDNLNNNKLNSMYLSKLNRMRNDSRLSILDAFQYQMRSCVNSPLANSSKYLFNEINYFGYFSFVFVVNLIVRKFIFF